MEEAVLEEAEFYNVAGGGSGNICLLLDWNVDLQITIALVDMVKVLKERIHNRDNSFGKSNGKHVYRSSPAFLVSENSKKWGKLVCNNFVFKGTTVSRG